MRTKELESKLELEHATRSRLEVQCNRHKESLEKTQTELIHIRSKETILQEELKKIKKTLRYLTFLLLLLDLYEIFQRTYAMLFY